MDFKDLNVGRDYQKDSQVLEKFAINVNQLVKARKIDPVIGREEEISRIIQILSRKTKNNPLLIGEPGVGKTAIVEGLATRIVVGDVPDNLKTKMIYNLDLTALIAGASFQGEFENRLKGLIAFVERSNGEIILFIDEVHTLVGAGRTQGALDASNILKPALAKGLLKCIGATTIAEYRTYIENDSALERRFQKVIVVEPTTDETLTILRGLKTNYEAYHGVHITDEALIMAIKLSTRYISERFLPDKAIDLIDEACAAIKTTFSTKPTELDSLSRKIQKLKVELTVLQAENNDQNSTINFNKITTIQTQIKTLEAEESKITEQWIKERKVINDIKFLKSEIENLRAEGEAAKHLGNYAEAGKILYSVLPEKQKQLEEQNVQARTNTLLKEIVDRDDVAKVLSRWKKIPLTKLLTSEQEKLLFLNEELQTKIINQNHAILQISNALIRSRANIKDPKRPIGTFAFLGPTGVGKTQLTKSLAEYLFDDEKNLIRIDMSECSEPYGVSKLLGAAPGYIGYGQGGQLTERVRHQPFSIVLFDEIEKAHRDVINVLLQILDDGQVRDSSGKLVDFKNTIIIMTSNIGANYALKNDQENTILAFEKLFNPEFVNRIDEIIVFNPLTRENIEQIINIQIKLLNDLLSDRGILVELTPLATNKICKEAYDPKYGARPIRRYIEHQILSLIARELVAKPALTNNVFKINVLLNNFVCKIEEKI